MAEEKDSYNFRKLICYRVSYCFGSTWCSWPCRSRDINAFGTPWLFGTTWVLSLALQALPSTSFLLLFARYIYGSAEQRQPTTIASCGLVQQMLENCSIS